MSSAAEEIVQIVDENNVETEAVVRSRMRRENLLHRSTFMFVFLGSEDEQKLIVQKRTLTKDCSPGAFDVCTGGTVQAGEPYDLNAKRELEEELGIPRDRVTWRHLFDEKFESERTRVWGRVYACEYGGRLDELVLQPEEVDSVSVMTVSDALERAATGKEDFSPDSVAMLKRYVRERK